MEKQNKLGKAINQLVLLGKAFPSPEFLGNASKFSLFLTAVSDYCTNVSELA